MLGVPLDVPPGGSLTAALPLERAVTAVALLTDIDSAPADGLPAADIVVMETSGTTRRRTLVAGSDTGDVTRLPADHLVVLPDGSAAVATEQPLGRPAGYASITVRNLSPGTLHVRALSVLDERAGTSTPVVLNEVLRPLRGTAPALYEDTRTAPRAAIVRRFRGRDRVA